MNDYIIHSGIKGMKWGIWNEETRRKRTGGKVKRSSNLNKELKSRKKERLKASKSKSLLSDKELDRRIKRLEKEKRLRELTDSEINHGKKEVKNFLSQHGNKIAAVVVGAIAVELGKQIVSGSKAKRSAREKALEEALTKRFKQQHKRQDAFRGMVGSTLKSVATGNGIPSVARTVDNIVNR